MTFARVFQDLTSHSETMSFDNHLDNDRGITNKLVDFSEDVDANFESNIKKTVNPDWGEAVLGWKNIAPSPRYLPHGVPPFGLKRRTTRYEWQRQLAADEQLIDNKISVKCINDDFDPLPIAAWKANVEQGTYRYVSNNGYYRTMKFLEQSSHHDWFTVTKKMPEKVSMTWQNKRFQKDLKRQLKRDFHSRSCKSESALAEMSKSEPMDSDRSNYKKEKRIRVKSVQPEATQPLNMLRDAQKERNKVLPELKDIPVKLSKSSSDLYLDSINTRINVLEEELIKDSKIRKPDGSETSRSSVSLKPQKLLEKDKEHPVMSILSKRETAQQEMMTIRPIGSKNELRPIEKVTPAQRFVTQDLKKAKPFPNHIRYTNSTGSDAANLTVPSIPAQFGIGTPELEKALNSYKLAIETTRQSLFHTLTGTKNPRRGTSNKNFGSTTAITFCDSLSNNADVDRNMKENVQSLSSGKHNDPHDKNSALLLPEISGKRLEVATTTNRWL